MKQVGTHRTLKNCQNSVDSSRTTLRRIRSGRDELRLPSRVHRSCMHGRLTRSLTISRISADQKGLSRDPPFLVNPYRIRPRPGAFDRAAWGLRVRSRRLAFQETKNLKAKPTTSIKRLNQSVLGVASMDTQKRIVGRKREENRLSLRSMKRLNKSSTRAVRSTKSTLIIGSQQTTLSVLSITLNPPRPFKRNPSLIPVLAIILSIIAPSSLVSSLFLPSLSV